MPYRRQAPVPLGLACRLVLKLGIHGLWGDEDEGRAYTCRMERASYTWYCPCMRWQATGPNWRGPTTHPDLLSAWLLADTPMLRESREKKHTYMVDRGALLDTQVAPTT